jgi:transcriptional regulator with XRE-family HTH domain
MKLIRTTELTSFCKMAGANLRKMRITRKLTQVEVGRAIGVRFQQIQKYEVGSNCLSAWRLKQLAAFFDVSPLDILDAEYIAKCCNKKESRTIPVLHEQWAIKNGYRENDALNSKNTLGFEDGAKR